MDKDEIVLELEEIEAVLSIFSSLYEDSHDDVKVKDIALVSLNYREKIHDLCKRIMKEDIR